MSFIAVQRVIVRMLYDPRFTDAVFESPDDALGSLDLSQEETGWLLATDRRAWRLDPMRRGRTLHALIEEYPATAASALSIDGHARRLDAFFSSTHFHDAIQRRRALVVAFGEFLEAGPLELTAMARIEAAIACCRRAPAGASMPTGYVTMTPGCKVLELPQGALARFSAIIGQLDAAPGPMAETMLADGFALDALPGLDKALPESVLLELGPRLGEIPSALAALLRAASEPLTLTALRQVAVDLGAEESEAHNLITELVEDGVLLGA